MLWPIRAALPRPIPATRRRRPGRHYPTEPTSASTWSTQTGSIKTPLKVNRALMTLSVMPRGFPPAISPSRPTRPQADPRRPYALSISTSRRNPRCPGSRHPFSTDTAPSSRPSLSSGASQRYEPWGAALHRTSPLCCTTRRAAAGGRATARATRPPAPARSVASIASVSTTPPPSPTQTKGPPSPARG